MAFNGVGGYKSNVLGFINARDSVRQYSKTLYGDVFEKPCYFSQTLGWTKWTFRDQNCCDKCKCDPCATPKEECCFKNLGGARYGDGVYAENGIGCCPPPGADRDLALGFGTKNYSDYLGDDYNNYNDIKAWGRSGCQPIYRAGYGGVEYNANRVPCGDCGGALGGYDDNDDYSDSTSSCDCGAGAIFLNKGVRLDNAGHIGKIGSKKSIATPTRSVKNVSASRKRVHRTFDDNDETYSMIPPRRTNRNRKNFQQQQPSQLGNILDQDLNKAARNILQGELLHDDNFSDEQNISLSSVSKAVSNIEEIEPAENNVAV